MDLYLVRHGLSLGNRDGRVQSATTELAPEGLAQAERTGRWLAGYFAGRGTPVAALYSSDYRRAWQTATIIGRYLDMLPTAVPGLREKHPGIAEGKSWAELAQLYPEYASAWNDFSNLEWGWPGGETRRQLRDRVVAAIATLAAQHRPGDQVVVVTHGGPIWAYLTGAVPGSPVLTDTDMANCSITHVHFPADGGTLGAACLLALNQTAHLDERE
jgi:broad specificity phosphatase PhoE